MTTSTTPLDGIFAEFLGIVAMADKADRLESNLKLRSKLKEQGIAGYDFSEKDLSGLDLSGLDLSDSNFNRCVMSRTKMDSCNLTRSSFVCPVTERMSMKGSHAASCYAHSTFFSVSNLSETSFEKSIDMTGSLFHGCSLKGSNFS